MELQFNGQIYEPDSIMFDVDGTIWDSTGVVEDAWNQAFKDSGWGHIHVTADRLKGLFGLPMAEIMRNIIPDINDEELEKFRAICDKYEEEYLRKKAGAPYEKITETIRDLSKKVPVIIVSNCQSGYIELVMEKLGLEQYVTDHICPGDSGEFKAANIRNMLKKHNLNNTVYVGDTHFDEEACNDAGVPIIFAAYGFGKVEKPAAIINTPYELLEYFK